ncbi:MAG: flagellar biosynthetic protein FliO [Candidatus Riflebacteria bacterium]|nr:flagellar biosynthetic protein FliO [Candidatus Riflebacteria bacterium]
MKKAINLAIIGIFVLIAYFGYAQTVVSENNGLFLSNNASASKVDNTQNFLNAVKTVTTDEVNENNKSKETVPVGTSNSKSLLPDNAEKEKSSISSSNNSTNKKTDIDEGSLPLFSSRTASFPNQLTPRADSFSATFSLMTSLIGIIILALAASWFIQKKTGIASNKFGRVLGVLPLDNKRLIYIVYVAGKFIVLGVTENSINYLTEITDKETIDTYKLKYQLTTTELDKNYPFNFKQEVSNKEKTDEVIKLEFERKSEVIKNEIEENRIKRENRLKDLISKVNIKNN